MVALTPRERMASNLVKASDEKLKFRDPDVMSYDEYSRFTEINPIGLSQVELFSDRGKRRTMEDVSFAIKLQENLLLGLFDGHGSAKAAQFASRVFQQNFSKVLDVCAGSVYEAFKRLFPTVQEAFVRSGIGTGGTTALVMYIDTQEQRIYTANLGDSEAYLYRKIDQKLKALPLTCVRNWGSPKDAKRLTEAMGRPDLACEYIRAENPKSIRYCISKGGKMVGLNVARAIGDIEFLHLNCKPVVIQKPKITEASYQMGDVLILGSDGLWDYTKQREVIAAIEDLKPKELVSSRVGRRALYQSEDNVSVIAVRFFPCPLCSSRT